MHPLLVWLLKLFSKLFRLAPSPPEKRRVVMQGLDAAGKHTILSHLTHHRDGAIQDVMPQRHCPMNNYFTKRVSLQIPTIGFVTRSLEHEESQLDIISWDVGGPDKIRPIWRFYMKDAQAFCFVIDANDRDRLEQAMDEMWLSMSDFQQLVGKRNIPVLVIANKQDLPDAVRPAEMANELNMHRLRQPWRLQGISATSPGHCGLHPAFDWLWHVRTSRIEFLRSCRLLRSGRAKVKHSEADTIVGSACNHLPYELCLIVAEYLEYGDVMDYDPHL